MLTYEQFMAVCPEFTGASVDLINRTLAMTARRIASPVWGVYEDEGHKFLTAHVLTMSPFGKGAKIKNVDGTSVYKQQYNDLVRIVFGGSRPLL